MDYECRANGETSVDGDENGMECHGVPEVVICHGKVVVEHGKVTVQPGSGRYLDTLCYCPAVYARIQQREKRVRCGVSREPYTGPVMERGVSAVQVKQVEASPNFHQRERPRSGGRHMQDSSFNFSGEQVDDQPYKSGRITQPPGGKSSGIF